MSRRTACERASEPAASLMHGHTQRPVFFLQERRTCVYMCVYIYTYVRETESVHGRKRERSRIEAHARATGVTNFFG